MAAVQDARSAPTPGVSDGGSDPRDAGPTATDPTVTAVSDPAGLQYTVTVTDPRTWTQPLTIAFPLRREPDYQILEYACHEGNYSMANTLSGSRADEEGGR
jgi:hypothetical protein